jgi:putative ABC transport system ATP-binding protein
MSFLELRNVSKSYGAGSTLVHALVDASPSVDRGNLVAVMGPSGSGKSSLLTIAGSLEEPTSGEVLIDGKSLALMSHNDKARLRRRTIGTSFRTSTCSPAHRA